MLKITESHPMDEYIELLSDSLKVYMEHSRLKRAYEDACYASSDFKGLALLWLKIESAGSYTSLNPDNIIDYLLKIGVNMERYARKNSDRYSLDMKRVVTPLIERGIAVEMLTAYKEYRTYTTYANFLRGLVNMSPKLKITGSGRVLAEFDTHIEEQENLRVYYNNIAVVSVPKVFSNMITAGDDGHYIAWVDYPQADWRFAYNMFIKDEDNCKIMSQCADAYEGLVRMVEGDMFDPVTFKEKRKEFKVHVLKVFYGSSDSSPVPTAIREFFQSCPKYQRLLHDLNILYHFKLPIPCTSYFGFEQLLPEQSYPAAFVNKALNTPIQTMTAHVVNETVWHVLHMFWDLGYTKDDINIYFVRHDEPLFVFSPKILKDAWVFKECSEIIIPGFLPFKLEFHFGKYYQQDDEDITRSVNDAIAKSNHQYTVYDVDESDSGSVESYWPYPSAGQVYVQVFTTDNGFDVRIYDYNTGKRKGFLVSGADDMQAVITEAFNAGGLEWVGSPDYLLARTSGFDFMDYVGPDDKTLLKVVDRPDAGVMQR